MRDYDSAATTNSALDMDTTTEHNPNKIEYEVLRENGHCSFEGDPLTMFLIGGVAMSVVSLIGIVGNVLSAIVLSRPAMRTSTNIILLCLSVCDFVFVSVVLLLFGVPYSIEYFCVKSFESFYFTTYRPIIVNYFIAPKDTALLGSIYFTVCVSLERFFVVYRPLMARPYCTNKNAVRVCLVIGALVILVGLPYWWEHSLESVYDDNGSWTHYHLDSSMSKNYYRYYRSLFVTVLYSIIPMTVLTLLNVSIYIKIRQANKLRGTMTNLNSSEISIAKILIWIVSIFLVCNVLEVYFLLKYALLGTRISSELDVITYFFFNLNSAVNFIVYCCMAKKFRLVFVELFLPMKLRKWGLNEGPGRRATNPQYLGSGNQTESTSAAATATATTEI